MPEVSIYDYRLLCQFTELLLHHGRDYAKEGYKDFARDIVRFVRNSRIVPILKAQGCELTTLESDLNWLSLACHPEDVPDFKPDLKAIRASLERIEQRLASSASQDLHADWNAPTSSVPDRVGGAKPHLPGSGLPCLLLTTQSNTQFNHDQNHPKTRIE